MSLLEDRPDAEARRSTRSLIAAEAVLRAVSIYLVIYLLPWPFTNVPIVGPWLDEKFSLLWSAAAAHLGTVDVTGGLLNGTSADEVSKVLVGTVVAIVIAGASTLLRPVPLRWLRRWGEPTARLALASALIVYGLNKVPPAQFSRPALQRLVEPVGELNMMELFWTFIGASPVYVVFSGLLELAAAALLLSRKTRVAGALLASAVLANVTMLNFCYDVVVKLYSAHLLAIAVGLCVPHFPRLLRFFTGRPTTADEHVSLAAPASRHGLRSIVVVWLVVTSMYIAFGINRSYHQMGNARAHPKGYGIFQVETFVEDGRERPPLLSDPGRWRLFIVDRALPMDLGEWGVCGFRKLWEVRSGNSGRLSLLA